MNGLFVTSDLKVEQILEKVKTFEIAREQIVKSVGKNFIFFEIDLLQYKSGCRRLLVGRIGQRECSGTFALLIENPVSNWERNFVEQQKNKDFDRPDGRWRTSCCCRCSCTGCHQQRPSEHHHGGVRSTGPGHGQA